MLIDIERYVLTIITKTAVFSYSKILSCHVASEQEILLIFIHFERKITNYAKCNYCSENDASHDELIVITTADSFRVSIRASGGRPSGICLHRPVGCDVIQRKLPGAISIWDHASRICCQPGRLIPRLGSYVHGSKRMLQKRLCKHLAALHNF